MHSSFVTRYFYRIFFHRMDSQPDDRYTRGSDQVADSQATQTSEVPIDLHFKHWSWLPLGRYWVDN